jgi:hypothetical protein
MYTDEELDCAVVQGIFTGKSVAAFRAQLFASKGMSSADEENFSLITGFNDIFVVIACLLLLFSSLWAFRALDETLGLLVFMALSWGLAEFFVLKRKMALPAIVLLLAFVGGVFASYASLFDRLSELVLMGAAILSAIAAYLHWRRFNVPITVAVGTAAAIGFLVALFAAVIPDAREWVLMVVFICGLMAFAFAMYWDASDRSRMTRRSDVAFWLHLVSAPLIIHPVFSGLDILEGNEGLFSLVIVLVLYLLMMLISIVVDRRIFMVSSLVYVLYALSNLLQAYGVIAYSFAVTGILIGAALLLLSAYWHFVRVKVLALLPSSYLQYVPKI